MMSDAIPGAMGSRAGVAARTLNGIARQLAVLPPSLLRLFARGALRGRGVALCLHRVGAPTRPDLLAELWSSRESIDAIIRLLRPGADGPEDTRRPHDLVLSFDDGYASACSYVTENAARFPDVTFAAFICPAKIERRVGFRWDLFEDQVLSGVASVGDYAEIISSSCDPLRENQRPELAGLADRAGMRLATIDECRALAKIPNAILGNHTNAHIPFTMARDEGWVKDLRQSFGDFERLFGPCTHFAIPFGAPWLEFTPEHIVMIRDIWEGTIWSTEPRAFRARGIEPGALLPRFAVVGTRSPAYVAARVALRGLLSGVRRPLQVPAGR